MHNITLVSTNHRESGRCSAEELLKILRAIGPEVVFEEVRPSDFDEVYKIQMTLEARAISRYRESTQLRQVPVDLYNDSDATVDRHALMGRVFDFVEATSDRYLDLRDERERLTNEHGFQYLNSEAFEKTTAAIEEIEDLAIKEAGDLDLIHGLQWWRETLQRREASMIRAIQAYCQDHVFENGVFLVGAAHKTSLVKAIREASSTGGGQITWSFTYACPN